VFIYLDYVEGVSLAVGFLVLGVGLIRGAAVRCSTEPQIEQVEYEVDQRIVAVPLMLPGDA
jgi:hypothetical protein